MSVSKCALLCHKRMKINKVSIERSQITKRHPVFSNPNIQVKRFDTPFGTMKMKISNKTMRTIEKYDNFQDFITQIKRKKLTLFGLMLRKKIQKHQNIQYIVHNTKKLIVA